MCSGSRMRAGWNVSRMKCRQERMRAGWNVSRRECGQDEMQAGTSADRMECRQERMQAEYKIQSAFRILEENKLNVFREYNGGQR